MKKFLKIILGSLLLIIILGVFGSAVAYNKYWAKDPSFETNTNDLEFFSETYNECRNNFRKISAKLTEKFDSTANGNISVPSKVDSDLTVDWFYIPAQKKAEKLLIINSGLHGVEGYTGSAVQLMFIREVLQREHLDNIGLLMIHGLNPYGFKYRRKVTENNVDLNRNCVIEKEMYASKNDGYGKLTNMLMPQKEVNMSSLTNKFFHLVAIEKIIQESMPVLRQAALQGQYEYPGGIYYGGQTYEPQIDSLRNLYTSILPQYDMILALDLHTAYGERGTQHLFLNPIDDPKVVNGIETIFANEKIDWGSGEDFYTINGEYLAWVGNINKDQFFIPMLLEYGTLDSQTTFGSLKSIQVMINENQGANFGYKNNKSEAKAKDAFSEMYYPTSPVWRSKIISDSRNLLTKMMTNLDGFEIKEE